MEALSPLLNADAADPRARRISLKSRRTQMDKWVFKLAQSVLKHYKVGDNFLYCTRCYWNTHPDDPMPSSCPNCYNSIHVWTKDNEEEASRLKP